MDRRCRRLLACQSETRRLVPQSGLRDPDTRCARRHRTCNGTFTGNTLPWPPSPTALPARRAVDRGRRHQHRTRARTGRHQLHCQPRSPELALRLPDCRQSGPHAQVERIPPGSLHDGCGGAALPPNGTPGGCRAGANQGVDPTTNELPAARVFDLSSSTPVVAPDGSILYGAYTNYNYARGHLVKFSPDGTFAGSYDFGWDTTPAIYPHDGTYSVIIKDNHYEAGSLLRRPELLPHRRRWPLQHHPAQRGSQTRVDFQKHQHAQL